jgi:uncharacterized protein (TIGR00251 family)
MARLRVRVIPRASRSEVIGYRDGVLSVRLAAPPVEGKANRELLVFLTDWLGIKRNRITIASGEKSRDKRIEIEGLSDDELESLLSSRDAGSKI